MAVKFREACRQAGQAQNLREVIVVMEPHKKFKPDRSGPEMHFHVVFRMRNNFAHLQITKWLANHAGCSGHTSYPRKGWKEMVRYVLEDSAVKLPVHMDQTPYFWPDEDKTMTKEKMLEKVGTSKEEEEKKEKAKKDEEFKEKKKRKRTLDFAQFTDWVINHKITNEAEYWVLAGEQKEKKDNPTLWNYGGQIKVDKMIQKAQRGHLASLTTDVFQFASKSTSPFPLSDFTMENDTKKKSLIIQGTGGLGKTQLAKAILASLGKYFFVDAMDTIKHLFFVDGEALLCDDVTLGDYQIDQVKSILDISCDRAIRCRHEDGIVPAGTTRIFLTNHEKHVFFPPGFQMQQHQNAIERRMTWVEVKEVLFKTKEMSVLDVGKRHAKAAAQGVRDQRAGSAKSEIPQVGDQRAGSAKSEIPQVGDQQAGSAKSEIPKVAAAEVRDPQADSGSQHKASQPSPTEFYEEAFLPEDEDFDADLDAARDLWDCSDNDDHGGHGHAAQQVPAVPEEMKSHDTAPSLRSADSEISQPSLRSAESDADPAQHDAQLEQAVPEEMMSHDTAPATVAAQLDAHLEQALAEEMKSPDTAPDALTAQLDADLEQALDEEMKSPDTAPDAVTAQVDADLEQALAEEMKSPDTAPDAVTAQHDAHLEQALAEEMKSPATAPGDPLSEREKPETQQPDLLVQCVASPQMRRNKLVIHIDVLSDPYRTRPAALGSSHKVYYGSVHSKSQRDRYRSRSPRWGTSHKVYVQRF